jgi:hypothetical protein
MTPEDYINHEVRIRILEDIAKKIDKRFDNIESKIDAGMKSMDSKLESKFMMTIGLILTSIIIPVLLHYLSLK